VGTLDTTLLHANGCHMRPSKVFTLLEYRTLGTYTTGKNVDEKTKYDFRT